jgi:hypothetical protein
MIPRPAIDAWPLAESGLGARPVTCLTRAGVATIGELRGWTNGRLLELPAFGPESLADVQWFFAWTDRLEAGTAELPDWPAWLAEFLTPLQRDVIEQRFGLTDPLFRPWLKRDSLRTIGRQMRGGITRERVRQIEEEGLARLRCRLARAVTPAVTANGRYGTWGVQALAERIFLAVPDAVS